ncbi:TPA: hypothetical protein QC072_005939, partial [Bacillus cereus]|nr:hypothetical protein [Bacillus cereus]
LLGSFAGGVLGKSIGEVFGNPNIGEMIGSGIGAFTPLSFSPNTTTNCFNYPPIPMF